MRKIKALIICSLVLSQAGCLSGGGGGSSAKTITTIDTSTPVTSPDEDTASPTPDTNSPPAWEAPQTSSAAEQELRGDYYSTRDADNYLKVDNQGNWSFQLESGYYRYVNSTPILTPYTAFASGTSPVAENLTTTWAFTFDLDVYPANAVFDGIYDDSHNRLAIDFVSEKCIVIHVKALNQTDYDQYCKQ